MPAAAVPHDEADRLAALRAYRILDTLPEAVFDDLTVLAANICDTPVALISLVDENRQWFKAKVGLEVDETPRDYSFCAYSALDGRFLEVPNATEDARFSDNPLVTGNPDIRFYAGAPLKTDAGLTLGSLCVIDHEPRHLTDRQRQSLQALSRLVMRHFEMRLLNEQLQQQRQEIETLMGQKSDLMSMLAHDMRGGIAGVIGFGNILLDDARHFNELSNEQRIDYLNEVVKCGENCLRLMSEFLSAENMAEPDLQARIDAVLVTDLIATVINRSTGHAQRKQIMLDVDVPPDIYAGVDERLFAELLDNLVNNALKYSPSGATVRVSAAANEDGGTVFRVKDQGPGFTEEDRKKLFGRFQRLSATPTDGEASSGLGLSIVKRLVDLHHGTIELNSTVGEGSQFTVTVPPLRQRTAPPASEA